MKNYKEELKNLKINILKTEIKQSIDIFNVNLNLCLTKFGSYVNINDEVSLYRKCLYDARQNEIKKSNRLFNNIVLNSDLSNYNSKELIHYNMVKQPILAYIQYKSNDFDKAIQTTLEIIKSSNSIENDCKVIVYFKIQQLHNISRVYLKKNDFENTIDINKKLLDFLLFNKKILYDNIDYIAIDEFKELKDLFVIQVFSELVHYFNYNDENYKKYFTFVFSNILKNYDKIDESNLYVYYWVKIYTQIYNNEAINDFYFDEILKYSEILNSTSLLDSLQNLLIKKSKNDEVLSST